MRTQRDLPVLATIHQPRVLAVHSSRSRQARTGTRLEGTIHRGAVSPPRPDPLTAPRPNRARTASPLAASAPEERDIKTIDRREFLKRSALFGAALTAAEALLPARSSATTDNVLWGANCLPRPGQRTQKQAVQAMESRLGRRFDTAHYRMAWHVPLVNDFTK